MKVISHRGFWIDQLEKNQYLAFDRSFLNGFGVETDIRDFGSQLVISHDPPDTKSMPLDRFFDLYLSYSSRSILALNIKADGLQAALQRKLQHFGIENYFVFDMSIPDGLHYLQHDINTYTRHSEYEPVPSYYDKACGVWMDEFIGHWITDDVIEQHLSANKSVCIVSPELHGRSFDKEWQHYRELEKKIGKERLMLCTDFPEHAQEFFNA